MTAPASGTSMFGGQFKSRWAGGTGLTLIGCCCTPGGRGLVGTGWLTCGSRVRYCPGPGPPPPAGFGAPPGTLDCCCWLGKPGTESRDCCCCWGGCACIPGCGAPGGPTRPGAPPTPGTRPSCPPSRCRCCCCAIICCNRSGGMLES